MAKKINRKKLLKEPDEFITFSARLLQFAVKHKNKIFTGLGGICFLLILLSGFLFFSNKAENKAFLLMQQGVTKFETLLKEAGAKQAYQAVKKDFEFILERYSNKDGGKLARVSFANICYQVGEYDQAIKLYLQSLQSIDDHSAVRYLVLFGLGYAYEAKKDYPAAVQYFQIVASEADAIMKDEALFHLGRMYAFMGHSGKSNDFFNRVITEYPDSIFVEIAKNKITG